MKDNKISLLKSRNKSKKDVEMRIFLLFIGIIALVSGIKFIYDARPIVKKYFSMSDLNTAVLGLKILGFLLIILGGLIIYFKF